MNDCDYCRHFVRRRLTVFESQYLLCRPATLTDKKICAIGGCHEKEVEQKGESMAELISRDGVSAWLFNCGHEDLADAVMDKKRFLTLGTVKSLVKATTEPDLRHGTSTLDEVIERFRHNAEYLRTRECDLAGSLEYRQIADWLADYRRIIASGNCNDCKDARDCWLKPEPGSMARFNCPGYSKRLT